MFDLTQFGMNLCIRKEIFQYTLNFRAEEGNRPLIAKRSGSKEGDCTLLHSNAFKVLEFTSGVVWRSPRNGASMNRLFALLTAILCCGMVFGCGSGGGGNQVPLAFTVYDGNWSGSWHNNTFNTTGSSTLAVTVNDVAKTIHFVITVNGNVFGSPAPPTQTFDGTYDANQLNVTSVSPVFGNISMAIDKFGNVTGVGTQVPSPNVSKVTFTGTWDGSTFNLNYQATLKAGGFASGTYLLTKNAVPL